MVGAVEQLNENWFGRVEAALGAGARANNQARGVGAVGLLKVDINPDASADANDRNQRN
jgi:hypothetical protein